MHRFFVENSKIQGNNIFIYGEDIKHISVLRMKKNEKLIVCDRQNVDYNCIIKNVTKEFVEVEIIEQIVNDTEPKIKITLYQSLPKLDKMEFIIQKCVEVGVNKIIPIITERTIVKIEDNKKSEKKIERFNKISEVAAKQSMRGKIPEILDIISYKEALEQTKLLDLALIAYENEKLNSLRSLIQNFSGNSIGIFIGPEGGFTEKEISMAKEYNIKSISLGNRILRTETAGLVTIANILYELEH